MDSAEQAALRRSALLAATTSPSPEECMYGSSTISMGPTSAGEACTSGGESAGETSMGPTSAGEACTSGGESAGETSMGPTSAGEASMSAAGA